MATKTLTDEERHNYKELFGYFDLNHDGHIDKAEFGKMLRALGEFPTEDEIKQTMAQHDSKGKGEICFDDFCQLIGKYMDIRVEPMSEEELIKAFKIFDRDGDGYVDAKELKYVLTQVGDKLTNEEADELIKEFDRNGDGRLDYQECRVFLMENMGFVPDIK